jgi:hypothetical protein
MHTLSIRLDDSIYEHFKEFLKFYPKNKLAIVDDEEDMIASELKKRIQDIDDGKMEMIPFQEGMDKARAKLMIRYENRSNS